MPEARREIQHTFTRVAVRCPYCGAEMKFGIMDKVLVGRRRCAVCRKEFLFESDQIRKPEQKKTRGSVRTNMANRLKT